MTDQQTWTGLLDRSAIGHDPGGNALQWGAIFPVLGALRLFYLEYCYQLMLAQLN